MTAQIIAPPGSVSAAYAMGERCKMATDCLPMAECRTRLEALHAEMLAEIERLREAVRSVRDDEARHWSGRVDAATARLLDMDAQRAAILKAVADGVALQTMTLILPLEPDAGHTP